MKKQSTQTSLILVGRSGSGKSTLGRALGRAARVPVFEMGDTVRAAAALADTNPLEFANYTFSGGGGLEFLQATLPAHVHGPIVLVGVRRPDELAEARRRLDVTLTIALTVSDDVRRARQLAREWQLGTATTPELAQRLEERDAVEAHWGLDETMLMADIVLDATLSERVLRKECLSVWADHSVTV